jgi:anti-sigma B factor antagonist
MKHRAVDQDSIVIERIKAKHATKDQARELSERCRQHIQNGKRQIIVDMPACEAVDAHFLSGMVGNLRAINNSGGDIHISGLRPSVRLLFEVTKLTSIFNIFKNVDDAIIGITNLSNII